MTMLYSILREICMRSCLTSVLGKLYLFYAIVRVTEVNISRAECIRSINIKKIFIFIGQLKSEDGS